jgi:hypothetical protein
MTTSHPADTPADDEDVAAVFRYLASLAEACGVERVAELGNLPPLPELRRRVARGDLPPYADMKR